MSKLGLEIKEKIDFNNKLIQEALTPNMFTLNTTVNDLLAENRKLQKKCPHEFDEEDFCIYCMIHRLSGIEEE